MTLLADALAFTAFLHQFREVERMLYVNGTKRRENDVEHSYMLCMLAWHLASKHRSDLDISRVIQYALVHDIVEIYSGDTDAFGDESAKATKAEREHVALLRIESEYGADTSWVATIRAYESRADAESKFVYALDKIQPDLLIYLDQGRSWRDDDGDLGHSISAADLKGYLETKMAVDPTLYEMQKEFFAIIDPELFASGAH